MEGLWHVQCHTWSFCPDVIASKIKFCGKNCKCNYLKNGIHQMLVVPSANSEPYFFQENAMVCQWKIAWHITLKTITAENVVIIFSGKVVQS